MGNPMAIDVCRDRDGAAAYVLSYGAAAAVYPEVKEMTSDRSEVEVNHLTWISLFHFALFLELVIAGQMVHDKDGFDGDSHDSGNG